MNKSFFFLSILFFSSINAILGNYWNFIKHGFKSIFSYDYVMNQQHATELNSWNQLLKTELDKTKKENRKTANATIFEEIKKPGISDFFTQSKPSFSTI